MLAHAPTIQRSSTHLLLSLCAVEYELAFFTRYVSQAYLQSDTTVQRPIYNRPPGVLQLPSHTLPRVDRPIYGLPEAGVHWFRTYHNHSRDTLKLQPSILDPWFLYTPRGLSDHLSHPTVPPGFTCLQTDDTGNVGKSSFIEPEISALQNFDYKDPIFIHDEDSVTFNGSTIKCDRKFYSTLQPPHLLKL